MGPGISGLNSSLDLLLFRLLLLALRLSFPLLSLQLGFLPLSL